MDLQRLLELEKLAGLRLDPRQREKMLEDLIQMEKFASNLPEITPPESDESTPANGRPGEKS